MRKDLGKIARFWNRPTECWKKGCGRHSQLEAAHIIPNCLYGKDEPENLVILCKECHACAPNVNDREYMWEYINQDKIYMGSPYVHDALNKLFDLCKNVDTAEFKKYLGIMKCKEYLPWLAKNTGHHGFLSREDKKLYEDFNKLSTHNWVLRNYPPFKELLGY